MYLESCGQIETVSKATVITILVTLFSIILCVLFVLFLLLISVLIIRYKLVGWPAILNGKEKNLLLVLALLLAFIIAFVAAAFRFTVVADLVLVLLIGSLSAPSTAE